MEAHREKFRLDNKNTTKNYDLEKGRKMDVKCTKFWVHFLFIFHQKMRPKIDAKNYAEKHVKKHEN